MKLKQQRMSKSKCIFPPVHLQCLALITTIMWNVYKTAQLWPFTKKINIFSDNGPCNSSNPNQTNLSYIKRGTTPEPFSPKNPRRYTIICFIQTAHAFPQMCKSQAPLMTSCGTLCKSSNTIYEQITADNGYDWSDTSISRVWPLALWRCLHCTKYQSRWVKMMEIQFISP